MRTNILGLSSLAGLLLVAACNSSDDNVGANPSAGAAGSATGGQAGSGQAGSAQAGSAQAGSAQAGAGGGSQAGTGGNAGQTFEQKKSDKSREDGSKVSDADKKAVVDGNSAFAFAMYGQLKDDPQLANKNVFFSPISFTMALGMTSSGAVGLTQSDIHQGMHYTLADSALHPALNWLSLELSKRPQQARDYAKLGGATTKPDVTLNLVNAVWGEKTDVWQPTFLDVLAQDYGTGVNLADFKNDSEHERGVINQWVADQTEQRIKDLLPPGSVNNLSRLVLVNAIDLTFAWEDPFKVKDTKAATFTPEGGAAKSVPTMAKDSLLSYAEDSTAQSVVLPLFSGRLSVVVYVPKAGKFATFESQLASEVTSLQGKESSYDVDLTLPKFTFTTPTLSTSPYLQNLGMKAPFTLDADFSGMTTTDPIHVSEVYHKAMLGFDEVGVQAAAATAVALEGGTGPGGNPPPSATLHVDRSFLVGIRDNETGALLFFGRIMDPTQT